MNQRKEIIFIVGPTAVGKSDVALELARQRNGEIISCDSMQIYKEISIASNKPSEAQLHSVPHHLIDVVFVEDEFDVVQFNRMALKMIDDIHGRDRVPIIVAGSGMYMQILLDGIFEGHGKDEAVRNALQIKAEEEGIETLYQKLQEVDPKAASKIHMNDARRIIRALEIYETADQPISKLQTQRSGLWGKYDIKLFGLKKEREQLYERINKRVDAMFNAGLVDEVKRLKKLKLSLTAQHLIGIKEVLSHLNGDFDLETAKEKMKQNTRHLAKRQMTWFNKEKRIVWIDGSDKNVKEIISAIEEGSTARG